MNRFGSRSFVLGSLLLVFAGGSVSGLFIGGDSTDRAAEPGHIANEVRDEAQPLFKIGKLPKTPADLNENTRSVAEAFPANQPSRISTFQKCKPFDRRAFDKDPKPYLDEIEPGRIYDTAQPGPGIPAISVREKNFFRILQGETAVLRVDSKPGTAVTFCTLDCGAFSNQLPCITVRADEFGVAVAHYKATTGVSHNVNILAASPECSGQARFKVFVIVPANNDSGRRESP